VQARSKGCYNCKFWDPSDQRLLMPPCYTCSKKGRKNDPTCPKFDKWEDAWPIRKIL